MANKKKSNNEGLLMLISFLLVLFLVYSADTLEKEGGLKKEAKMILDSSVTGNTVLNFINPDGTLNEEKFIRLSEREYQQIKEELELEHDFCIYIADEEGNPVIVYDHVIGIGSPDIKVAGKPCKG